MAVIACEKASDPSPCVGTGLLGSSASGGLYSAASPAASSRLTHSGRSRTDAATAKSMSVVCRAYPWAAIARAPMRRSSVVSPRAVFIRAAASSVGSAIDQRPGDEGASWSVSELVDRRLAVAPRWMAKSTLSWCHRELCLDLPTERRLRRARSAPDQD